MIQFDKDKMLHAAVGVMVGVLGIKFLGALAFPVLLAVAVGKEVYDYFHPAKHTSDVADALVTIGAGTTAMYVTRLF